jgi:hypothetical protein
MMVGHCRYTEGIEEDGKSAVLYRHAPRALQ